MNMGAFLKSMACGALISVGLLIFASVWMGIVAFALLIVITIIGIIKIVDRG